MLGLITSLIPQKLGTEAFWQGQCQHLVFWGYPHSNCPLIVDLIVNNSKQKMKRWRLAMLTIVLALAFSMEQADLGVVQSLYGTTERFRICSRWIDEDISWLECYCNPVADEQDPLPGVSVALL